MNKIALLGGSFDPPHLGHLLVASTVLATQDVDELWFVPTYQHMMGKTLTEFDHRYEMVKLLAEGLSDAYADDSERVMSAHPDFRGSLTVDLIQHMTREFTNHEFRFVIGSDILAHAFTWEGWDKVVKLAPPIVVNREGYGGKAALVLPNISSTDVKRMILAGDPRLNEVLPRTVRDYIIANKLYGSIECPTCHQPYRAWGIGMVCSNAFHCCRTCTWRDGQIISRCDDCQIGM